MVWGQILAAVGTAAISALPSFIMGERQIQRKEKHRAEEKAFKVADLTRAYTENLQRTREDYGMLYGQQRGRQAAGGVESVYGDITYSRKKSEMEGNLFSGYSSTIGALGYRATKTATGAATSLVKPSGSSSGGGKGFFGSIISGIGNFFGGLFGG